MTVPAEQLQEFLLQQFPQGDRFGTLLRSGDGWAEMSLEVGDEHLRPGGTVSGPTLMALADVALYAALLSRIGLVPLAVTNNLNINFLSKPVAGQPIIAYARMLRVGRTLGVGEVYLHSSGKEDPVAHATMTYSIPSR
ncbi:MAG: PaaI family thioesterase [Oleiphilaceae bacterium]|nr:PaaI family thioesterase [Oleiphilaceae bacterium]